MAKIESSTFLSLVAFILFTWKIHESNAVRPPHHTIRYGNFEDYLRTLDRGVQELITSPSRNERRDEFEGSGEPEEGTSAEENTTPLAATFWSRGTSKLKMDNCCILGQLAGDKGYHCYVKFYAARILMRNQNRVHNRKMSFYGRERVPNYGNKVMRTFEKCIAGSGHIFHKCCYLADMERKAKVHYDTQQKLKFKRKSQKARAKVVAVLDDDPQ